MAVTLYDKNGNVVTHHDLQDKIHWCSDGETKEQVFIRMYGNSLGFVMNPQKVTDPFAPDLISLSTGTLTDLKSQHSPFFKAKDFYQIDPTYAVVFNEKDKLRYEKNYQDIDILYYINWIALKANIYGKTYEVQPLFGIYKISFKVLLKVLSNAHLHIYKERRSDTQGNAKKSFVIDIRNSLFEKLL